MPVFPQVRAARYEQLEAGELFLFVEDSTYALKTSPRSRDDRNLMVLLGPTFKEGVGSHLLDWQAATVLSFGRNFTVQLPTNVVAWFRRPTGNSQVWLAVAEQRVFVRTNIGRSPKFFEAGYVDLATGEIIEGELDNRAVYTNSWEIVAVGDDHLHCSILKYELPGSQ